MDVGRFDRLYAEHADRLYGFIAYRVGDPVTAEDLLADVFERALRRRSVFDRRRGSEATWLFAIALNRVRDHHRHVAAERRAIEAIGETRVTARDLDEPIADRDLVRHALEALSPEERECVALKFGADLTAPQIARITGEPLTTVEGRIYRGLRKMRTRLDAMASPVAAEQAVT